MQKWIYCLVLMVLIQFMITGCANKQTRMEDFVIKYNKSAASVSNIFFSQTYAETTRNETIKIVLKTNVKEDYHDEFKNILPDFYGAFLLDNKKIKELAGEGVKFELVSTNHKSEVMDKILIDSQNLEDFENRLINKTKNSSYKYHVHQDASIKNLPELKLMLTLISKDLPQKAPEEPVNLQKLYVNEKNELVSVFVVNHEEMVQKLKDEKEREFIKKQIMLDSTTKNALRGFQKFKVKNFTYIYHDQKGRFITQIKISPENIE